MTIPHIYIKKGAILKGVNLVGLNVVFEIDQLPTGGNDAAMVRAVELTAEHVEDVYITDCMRATGQDLAKHLTDMAITKAKRAAAKR